ncbi:hypothetical protein Hanom_Chr06g00491911 [Helianthus anomalus]
MPFYESGPSSSLQYIFFCPPVFCEHTFHGSENPPPLLNDISLPPPPIYFPLLYHNRCTFTGESIRIFHS